MADTNDKAPDGASKEVDSMLLFKSCPRCRGDMYVNRDIYGEYKECLSCGMMADVEPPPARESLLTASSDGRNKGKRKVA